MGRDILAFGHTVLYDPSAAARSEHHYETAYTGQQRGSLTSNTYGQHAGSHYARPKTASEVSPTRSSSRSRSRPNSTDGVRRDSRASSGSSFFDAPSNRGSKSSTHSISSSMEKRAPWNGPDGRTDLTSARFRCSTPEWQLKDGWVAKPKLRTRRELMAQRKKALLPNPSFDVDGDGVVSAQDYFLSSKFDVNKDGFIDDDERKELRKTMVGALVKKYQSAPKLESLENDRLIKKFTRDIDKTVAKDTFVHDFNELYNRTAMTQVADSTQVFGVLCPRELARYEQKHGTASKYSSGQVTARTNRDVTDDARPGFKVGSDHARWSGFESRSDLIKARSQGRNRAAVQRLDGYASSFPPPGNCNPNVTVLGPPGVRPSQHHRNGYFAPLL